MAKKKEEKTNVMRTLEQKKIAYTAHAYPHGEGEAPDGISVAQSLGQDPARVFKTLVTRGASGGYYVFDIPVAETLDLKKAAAPRQILTSSPPRRSFSICRWPSMNRTMQTF